MADHETPTPIKGEVPDFAQAPSLCTDCGLCCVGVIHEAAVLDEDEVAAATDIGLEVLDRPGRPGFALPCVKLDGTRCSIFGQRPRVCSRYMCQVLIDMQEERLSFEEAREHVRYARQLADNVFAVLPAQLSIHQAKAVARGGSGTTLLQLRLHLTALELYLDKHFRKAKEAKMLEMLDLEDGDVGP